MPVGGLHATHASASFRPLGDVWVWSVYPTPNGKALVIESEAADVVAHASRKMKRALNTFALNADEWLERSDEAKGETIAALMDAGRELAKALFKGRDCEFVKSLRDMEPRTLTSFMFGPENQHLIEYCVLSDGDREFFLGEWCLGINREVARQGEAFDKATERRRDRSWDRKVGYAEDGKLKSACLRHNTPTRPKTEEIFVVGDLLVDRSQLSVLDPLNVDPLNDVVSVEETQTLRAWLANRRDVVHFNCHAKLFEEDGRPRMRVRNGGFIGVPELPDEIDLMNSLVFLNACSSAMGLDSFRTSLAQYFLQQLAVCVVCTTGPIDDAFATRFARVLYRLLDEDRLTIMEALIKARQEIWRTERNPLVFAYTYIGEDDFTLS